MIWNLTELSKSSFEWKNVTLGGQNVLWPLLHIFRGSGPPQPTIYAPRILYKFCSVAAYLTQAVCCADNATCVWAAFAPWTSDRVLAAPVRSELRRSRRHKPRVDDDDDDDDLRRSLTAPQLRSSPDVIWRRSPVRRTCLTVCQWRRLALAAVNANITATVTSRCANCVCALLWFARLSATEVSSLNLFSAHYDEPSSSITRAITRVIDTARLSRLLLLSTTNAIGSYALSGSPCGLLWSKNGSDPFPGQMS